MRPIWISCLLVVGCRPAVTDDRPPPAASGGVTAAPPSAAPPAASPSAASPDSEAGGASCPPGMVAIPPTGPGGFEMGAGLRGESDKPHRVVLTRGYCLDATEVTVAAYRACVEASVCKLPYLEDRFATYPRLPDHPVNMVNWEKARAYCAWADKRLPTEAEWEWAAAGPEGSRWPWGDRPDPACGENADFTPLGAPKSNPGGDVGCLGGGTSPVGATPRGDRGWPGGRLHDLAGNVWEWTEDSYAPYGAEAVTDPLVRLESANHAIRGGGWNRPPRALQTKFRGAAVYTYQVPALGFRCAKGAPHATPRPRAKR